MKGRAGLAFDRSLIYGTGGFAYGKVRHRYNAPGDITSQTETQTGWVVGAGLEYAFAPSWSAKVEYNYVDLGDGRVQYGPSSYTEFEDKFHVVKAGINYRFSY